MAQTFTFETWNNANTPALTVGNFQSVAVDKRGKVWAGSLLGGLYCYRDTQWVKISTYPDITFRHLVLSNMPSDSNVWAASPGKSSSQAVNGGAYLIDTKLETVTQFGLAGGLNSNFVNSLALSSEGQAYAATQQSISGTTVRQGGVYKAFTQNPTVPPSNAFTKAIPDNGDITYYSAGKRGEELWFGRGANCASGCQAPYITVLNASGKVLSQITADTINKLPFTATSASAFPRAIFTDSNLGNTFIGLNSGGAAVCKSNGKWHLLTSNNSPFPAGAAVNFNAITEVYGEVWIGTSLGIFVYKGRGAIEDPASYKLLTTANGLPNNFVTNIAVDTARKKIWITTSTGISRCDYAPPTISGYVFDAGIVLSAPNYSTAPRLSSDFIRYPPDGVLVSLYEGDHFIEAVIPEENGFFEFSNTVDGKNYRVEYKYTVQPQILAVLDNVKNHSLLPVVAFPMKEVSELKTLKPYLKERIFKLPASYFVKPEFKWNGFDVSSYDQLFLKIESGNLGQLNLEELQRITDNLANFYSSAVTVYTLGGNSTELIHKSIEYALQVMEAMLDFVSIGAKTNKTYGQLLENQMAIQFDRQLDNLIMMLKRVAQAVPDSKETIKKVLGIIEEAKFLKAALAFDGGTNSEKMSFIKDQFKKAIAYVGGGIYYRDIYCGYIHQKFINDGTSAANNVMSNKKYSNVRSVQYSTQIAPSLEILNITSAEMDQLKEYAAIAKYTSNTADLFSKITLLTPGAWLAPWFKAAATAANALRVGFLTGAMIKGYQGGANIADLSRPTLNTAGLKSSIKLDETPDNNPPVANISFTAAQSAKLLYQQRAIDLQTYFNSNTYDSAAFFPKLKNLGKADSSFNKELKAVLEAFNASIDSAQIAIPGFSNKYSYILDTFITKGNFMRESLFYNNLAYIYDSLKTGYQTDFKRMSDSVILLNDSALLGLQRLNDSLLLHNVKSTSNLVRTDFTINHSFHTNQPGSFTYTFTNFGGVTLPALSFKIKNLTGGYVLVGSDSLTKGDVVPGQSITAQFSYNSPAVDSIGYYDLIAYSNGQEFASLPGALFALDPTKYYSIKDGNWSDPSVWINGMVPTSTSNVEVTHNITVDINASCKTLRNIYPGNINLAPGKKLDFVK